MLITQTIERDFALPSPAPCIHAVQGDENTRAIQMKLYDNHAAWAIPEDAAILIRYRKPDGTGGIYDTLSDGTAAWIKEDNTVTLLLAPELLSAAGIVDASVAITAENQVLGTFLFRILVAEDPSADVPETEKYYNLGSTIADLKAYVDEKTAQVSCCLTEETVSTEETFSPIPVQSISLDHTELTLKAGETTQLAASVSPSNASSTGILWDSTDTAIAAVEDGLVTAIAAGSCDIVALSTENGTIAAVCTVTVAPTTNVETKQYFIDIGYAAQTYKKDGTLVTLPCGYHLNDLAYSEGMYIITRQNLGWLVNYPPFILDTDAGYVVPEYETVETSCYQTTLTGYTNVNRVLVNVFIEDEDSFWSMQEKYYVERV